jgi:hypothetical protein
MPVKGSTKKTNSPEAKARVIRRRMRGETIRQIAAAEGIARNTVIRILSLPEVQRAVNRTRSLILHSADQLAERLMAIALGKSKKGDRQALVDLLRGIGVLTAKFEVSDLTEQERDHSSSMFLYYVRFGRWPTLKEAKEFEETVDIPLLTKGSA